MHNQSSSKPSEEMVRLSISTKIAQIRSHFRTCINSRDQATTLEELMAISAVTNLMSEAVDK